MKYRFEVFLNDEDYIAYNQFYMLNSKQGRQNISTMRIIISVVLGVIMLVLLTVSYFSIEGIIDALPYAIALVLFHVFIRKIYAGSAKGAVKNAKKHGKAAYSPHSIIEFYDDHFVSMNDHSRTEEKYSSIEGVSVIRGRYVYIHLNSIMSEIISYGAFESEAQFKDFLYFMSGICGGIDYYDDVK